MKAFWLRILAVLAVLGSVAMFAFRAGKDRSENKALKAGARKSGDEAFAKKELEARLEEIHESRPAARDDAVDELRAHGL